MQTRWTGSVCVSVPNPFRKRAWLGVHTKNDAGRLIVTRIPRGTPAFHSGLSVEDEIIAIGGFRVRADRFSDTLEHYRPEEEISILVARREKLIDLSVRLGADPGNPWRLEVIPHATQEQKRHLENWLQ
jgi:predicted metalloprotease with PDZ domain